VGGSNGRGGTDDPRHFFLLPYLQNICHPGYRGLDELLKSLFQQLSGYQEQVVLPPEQQDTGRMKDEYLHEAFQRTILNFILKNINEPFMKMPISPNRRLKKGGGMAQSTKTPRTVTEGVKRKYPTMAGVEKNDPNKKYVFTNISPPRRH
jgi:hypothetical protein